MKYKRLLVLLSLLPLLINQPVLAESPRVAPSRPLPQSEVVSTLQGRQMDQRAEILRAYLASHDAPLQYFAQDFVDAADKYNLDWKLVAAISGVESTFGKQTPGNEAYPSYNGWGWGVYGTQAIYFKSWRDGIYTVSEGLRKNYFDKGLTDPYQINAVYAASPTWGTHVSYFLNDISSFEKQYKSSQKQAQLPQLNFEAGQSGQVKTISGQLALD